LFRNDRKDDQRSGRPSTSKNDENVSRVSDLLNADRRTSVRMMAETLNIPRTIAHNMVSNNNTNNNLQKVCAKLVPELLTDDHEKNRVTIATELLERVQNKTDFLDHSLATPHQSLYSPDLSPANPFLFPRIKTTLKGTRFENIKTIKTTVTKALNEVSAKAFQNVYRRRKNTGKSV